MLAVRLAVKAEMDKFVTYTKPTTGSMANPFQNRIVAVTNKGVSGRSRNADQNLQGLSNWIRSNT